MSPVEFITHMYNRSITTKAFKEQNYILAPGTEFNIITKIAKTHPEK